MREYFVSLLPLPYSRYCLFQKAGKHKESKPCPAAVGCMMTNGAPAPDKVFFADDTLNRTAHGAVKLF